MKKCKPAELYECWMVTLSNMLFNTNKPDMIPSFWKKLNKFFILFNSLSLLFKKQSMKLLDTFFQIKNLIKSDLLICICSIISRIFFFFYMGDIFNFTNFTKKGYGINKIHFNQKVLLISISLEFSMICSVIRLMWIP